jgi:hypothetical protein
MTKLIYEHKQYERLLFHALQLFYRNDATDLFGKSKIREEESGNEKIVNERAMVGCVYRYMWCLMQQKTYNGIESDIDIEYDRMVKDNLVYYAKEIPCECSAKDCEKKDKCIHEIIAGIRRRRKGDVSDIEMSDIIKTAVRPDVIVHNRNQIGQSNNGLVVEFKKEYAGLSDVDIAFDKAKVYYFTCDEESTHFHYKIGAMVMLHPKYADVLLISKRNIMCGYKVYADKVEKIKADAMELETYLLKRNS